MGFLCTRGLSMANACSSVLACDVPTMPCSVGWRGQRQCKQPLAYMVYWETDSGEIGRWLFKQFSRRKADYFLSANKVRYTTVCKKTFFRYCSESVLFEFSSCVLLGDREADRALSISCINILTLVSDFVQSCGKSLEMWAFLNYRTY